MIERHPKRATAAGPLRRAKVTLRSPRGVAVLVTPWCESEAEARRLFVLLCCDAVSAFVPMSTESLLALAGDARPRDVEPTPEPRSLFRQLVDLADGLGR